MAFASQTFSSQRFECNTYVFIDLETTGLINDPPVRITELNFCAIGKSQFLQGMSREIPRVSNSLNLCINPTRSIHPTATRLTKLDLTNLEHQSEFNEDVFNNIFSFLNRLKRPICLIAHNGFKFDFPILRAEIDKLGKDLPTDILCADSLEIFQNQENKIRSKSSTTFVLPSKKGTNKRKGEQGNGIEQPIKKSFRLEDFYERRFGEKPPVSHEAKDDVLSLLYSSMSIRDDFVEAVSATAIPFVTIKKSW